MIYKVDTRIVKTYIL